MKLDVNVLRYLSKEEFRVLTSVEMGQKNHELVPVPLIDSISGLKHGGAVRCLRSLLRHKLVHHDGSKYQAYRLTPLGYDFLAIRALAARGSLASVGRQIGVGKESDIFEVLSEDGEVLALKLHRLGRTSFRAVKAKRDYLGSRSSFSWLYLSRLAALKEYAFMRALGDRGFPVPRAVDHSRHAVLMSMLDAQPLVQLRRLEQPRLAYQSAMRVLFDLAAAGLVHCDFNEFNIMIGRADESLTVIDFPQMVSAAHANARELFERDVECIVRFFTKKLGYHADEDDDLEGPVRPSFDDALAAAAAAPGAGLDVALAASGFKRQHQTALEAAFADEGSGSGSGSGSEEGEGEEDEGEGEESSDEGGSGSGSGAEAEEASGAAGASGSGGGGGEALSLAALRLADGAGAGKGGDDDAPSLGSSFGPDGDDDESEDGGSGSGSGSGSEEDESGQRDGNGRARGRKQRNTAAGTGAGGGGGADADAAARAVQQRLVQQRRKAERVAQMARATRNTSKVKDRKARKAAAAVAEW